jgi:hypothetical protein
MFCPREMIQYFDRVLRVVLAALALQLQHNLLGGLGLKITAIVINQAAYTTGI